jgi:hypothetical protein
LGKERATHAQTSWVVGRPTSGAVVAPSVADEIVLMTGTLWHDWAHTALVATGLPFMQEVKLTPWLPEGWAGKI